jgi:hypothetical protein
VTIRKDKLRRGLSQIRDLVDGTHWIKGTYIKPEYLEGDGEYEDGSIVQDTKVIGCLVGLSRLVAAKRVTYVRGKREYIEDIPASDEFSTAMEDAMRQTIIEQFLEEGYLDDDFDTSDLSIEGWNDQNVRTKEQVLEMLDATLVRLAPKRAAGDE